MTHAYRFVRRLATCGMAVTLAAPSIVAAQSDYRVVAANKTSTMQKEIKEAAEQGYDVVGMAVGETLMGGSELVTIMKRPRLR